MTGFIPLFSFLIILILIIGNTIVLRKSNIRISSGTGRPSFSTFVLYLVFLLILLLYIFELSQAAFQFTFSVLPTQFTIRFFSSILLEILGIGLQLFSLIFLFFTLRHFGKSLRFGMNTENRGELITNGVFSISRNPFFTALLLHFIGSTLLIPSPFFIGFTLAAIIGIHLFIFKEEKFMLENYGEEYKKYRKKVRRYF